MKTLTNCFKQKYLLILTLYLIIISGNSVAQNNWTVHGGVKFIEYRGSNIQLYYRDESPDPDDFYADIDLSEKIVFNIGGNFNNYSKAKKVYYDLTGNLYFGIYLGLEAGASVGYPFFLNQNKTISILPSITGGGGWYNKSLGTLENNTVYIQVNETQFKDYENVDLSLSGFYGFIKPTLALLFDVTSSVQTIFSFSYALSFTFNPVVDFSGTDQDGNDATASENLSEPNLAFFIDNERSEDTPFKLTGFEVRIGLSFNVGN